jgi:hypothetical protein
MLKHLLGLFYVSNKANNVWDSNNSNTDKAVNTILPLSSSSIHRIQSGSISLSYESKSYLFQSKYLSIESRSFGHLSAS